MRTQLVCEGGKEEKTVQSAPVRYFKAANDVFVSLSLSLRLLHVLLFFILLPLIIL
jgi:hypothetical protein